MRIKALVSSALALSIVGLVVAGCGSSTPAAAPATPAPAATPAAAAPAKAPAVDLIVFADTVRSTFNVPADQAADKGCVLNNRYLHNEGIVFRIRITDPATGKAMDDKSITKAELVFADKTVIPLKYGPHGKPTPTDSFWSAGFHIPENYPSGKLNYTINVVANDGRKGAPSSTIKGDTSDLVILDGKVPVLPPAPPAPAPTK